MQDHESKIPSARLSQRPFFPSRDLILLDLSITHPASRSIFIGHSLEENISVLTLLIVSKAHDTNFSCSEQRY
jgi:hypothetical protein